MQITPKARLISIIVAVVFMFGALAGTGAYLIVNHLNNAKATTQTDTSIDNIFNPNGTINATAAVDLLEAVGFFDNRNDTGTYKAHQIRTRNSSTGTDVTANPDATIIFPMGYAGTDGKSGEDIYWQATYLYNNYLTIWMVKNYTNSTWNESSVTVNYTSYPNSTIQNYLDNTLWSALTMGSGTLQSIFATPATVGYQELKSGTTNDTSYWYGSVYTSRFDNMSTTVGQSSYLWLPSFGEVFNNTSSSYTSNTSTYTGQWGLNSTDRSFNTRNYNGTSTTGYCWLRSGSL